MMFYKPVITVLLYVATGLASMYIRPSGWLDRVVHYYKDDFVKDLLNTPHVNIKARIEAAPPGYRDSTAWDFPSVIRLMFLLLRSDGNEEVWSALRRSLTPTRRSHVRRIDMMTLSDSVFNGDIADNNDLSMEGTHDGKMDSDDDIIYVSNPVEARLPGASISVKLLRKILWRRAKSGRYLEYTTKITINWKDFAKNATMKKITKGAETTSDIVRSSSSGTAATVAADGTTGGAAGVTTVST